MKINSDEWLAELERLRPEVTEIIPEGGFTKNDVARYYRRSNTTACNIIMRLIERGIVTYIGRRPGRNGCKVYDFKDNKNGKRK